MESSCVFEIRADFPRALFVFLDLLVRMCLIPAFLLLTFPVPVILNLFAAPLFVFIFGIRSSFTWLGYYLLKLFLLLDRRDKHRHVAAFELGRGFDSGHVLELFGHALKHPHPEFRVRYLSALEDYEYLDLIPFA